MMNYGKLTDWLQISANIGIVVGLVLVGVQLQQNTNLLKTQLMYEESYRATELETQVIGENAAVVWSKAITDAKSLNLAEQRIMEAILWSFVEQLRGTHLLAELGLLEEADWRARVDSDAAFQLSNEYGLAWWANFSDGSTSSLPDDLIAAINARLAVTDSKFTLNYTKSTMELLTKQDKDGS